ncbi:MAG: lipoyl synthase [Candidatus Eisenbacteria bacterium]
MALARLPLSARKPFFENDETRAIRSLLETLGLRTVCKSARCPNRSECYSSRALTFMILGDTCTRNCRFCSVAKGVPENVEPAEPSRIAHAARTLGLEFVTATSVTRDDLADGGAAHFVACVVEIRRTFALLGIEVLVPDFGGDTSLSSLVLDAGPDVFCHNVETVPRLYRDVRPGASYVRSLRILEAASRHSSRVVVKSGLMVGLGETEEEVIATLRDLRNVGCRSVTIGQYLRPARECLPVSEYVPPERLSAYEETCRGLGFGAAQVGTFVRSSYKAREMWRKINGNHYSKQEFHCDAGRKELHRGETAETREVLAQDHRSSSDVLPGAVQEHR